MDTLYSVPKITKVKPDFYFFKDEFNKQQWISGDLVQDSQTDSLFWQCTDGFKCRCFSKNQIDEDNSGWTAKYFYATDKTSEVIEAESSKEHFVDCKHYSVDKLYGLGDIACIK